MTVSFGLSNRSDFDSDPDHDRDPGFFKSYLYLLRIKHKNTRRRLKLSECFVVFIKVNVK